jgi:hypothetical protein
MIEVAENDLDMEAIRKISVFERGALVSIFFKPKELV